MTMKIKLDSNPKDAPGCLKIVAEDGRALLIQTDWDWPGVASSFGWSIKSVQQTGEECFQLGWCEHRATDGTVPCPDCGLIASDFIGAARQWMDENDGAEVEDIGYFDN